MVKNTFKLVFIYAIILGIAGAIASGFINTGLIVFSLLDDWNIGYDSATESFASQNNFILLTIYKIIASILALLPLMLFIKFSTGAFIFKPSQLLAFTGRAGLNTVNRTGRGLFNAARNGIGNSMNAIRSIAKGDPMSMYRSARYAEMALGRNNKLSNILRRGADVSDFSQNLAGNKGEAKEDKDKKDGFLSKSNEKTQPKSNKDIARNIADYEKRKRALNDMRKSQKDHIKHLKNKKRNALKPEDQEAIQKEIDKAKEDLKDMRESSLANRASFLPGVDASVFNDMIEEYDKNHEYLEIGNLANKIPGGVRNASNVLNNKLTQILNATGIPQVKPTNAEGERGLFFASHSHALPVDQSVADAEVDKISSGIGDPSTKMAGVPSGTVVEEEREEEIQRIIKDGRGIPSDILSAAQFLGSFAAIYGGHLNPMHQFDANATRGQIERAHLDSAQEYANGMQPGVSKDKINEDIRRIQQDAKERSSLFTLDQNEFRHFAKESGIQNIGFKDTDSDMIGQLGNAYIYEDDEGNKAVRFSKMQIRENKDDPESATTLKNVDILLDEESQQKVKENDFSNEEIVRGLAEGSLNASSTITTGEDGQEETISTESISLVDHIKKEVELKKETEKEIKEYRQEINNNSDTSENVSTQRVETTQKEYIQPGETKTIQGAPISNTVANNAVQEVNDIAGAQVATVSDNGDMKISLNNEQIERLAAMRYRGESTKEAKGSEDTANFINNLLDSLLPGSSSDSPTVNNNYTNSDDNRTNNVSNYRNGDSVNITVNPSSGEQTFERSSRKETSASAPDVTIDGINKDLYDAQQSRNSRMLDEQLERSQEQLGKEERGNRLGGEGE